MIDPVWLDPKFLIKAHNQLINRYGGIAGIRDYGSLDAVLARPQQILGYSEDKNLTIFTLAAAIGWSLCRRHPFIDGNKRVSFVAVAVFLQINGYHLDVANREATKTMMAVASGNTSEEKFVSWIEDNSFETKSGL
ncbi:MAG: type II toxin-antitoxin system death-on-curing family toxin [Magnetococcales bacterium]|nr:type II toxin-antitoxin system death-on-curing family toxin [Magnetococcales bacterium]